MKKEKIPLPVYLASIVLGLYCLAVLFNVSIEITASLFFIFPFFMVWMVVSVLRSRTHNTQELAEGEEWGYADKKKEDLGTF
jgi:hypothetical protein